MRLSSGFSRRSTKPFGGGSSISARGGVVAQRRRVSRARLSGFGRRSSERAVVRPIDRCCGRRRIRGPVPDLRRRSLSPPAARRAVDRAPVGGAAVALLLGARRARDRTSGFCLPRASSWSSCSSNRSGRRDRRRDRDPGRHPARGAGSRSLRRLGGIRFHSRGSPIRYRVFREARVLRRVLPSRRLSDLSERIRKWIVLWIAPRRSSRDNRRRYGQFPSESAA